LREGLDIPEVSLVAILDADKEGFLRSETTMIQTIGRAARNIRGKAILYADKITGSMQRAIDETDRRRSIQEKYNKDNGIKPSTISTKVKDIMEGARVVKGKSKPKKKDLEKELKFAIKDNSIEELSDTISKLEDQMYVYAKDMEFEKAAWCRDKMKYLKGKMIDI
jgi:excinuclease ABC subunit B